MEISEGLAQQQRLQAIAEKRERMTEIENRKRQLEDDRRQLQHLKSKALRERWLLDGAPSGTPEQDEAKIKLLEDEAKTKELEESINRMEQELEELETGVKVVSTKDSLSGIALEEEVQTITIVSKSPGSVKEVNVQNSLGLVKSEDTSDVIMEELKVHISPHLSKSRDSSDIMMRAAMYSVEITVERDKVTGETKVLTSNTLLPVDLSQQGVKVYEDEQKVVHEVNGENGVHLLSSSEVDELLLKADEIAMVSEPAVPSSTTATTPQTALTPTLEPEPTPLKTEITGMEAKSGAASPQPGADPGVPEASSNSPVTMTFMGYQNVEDEAETRKVLGLEGTVKAELVVIDDTEGKTSPASDTPAVSEAQKEQTAPPNGSTTAAVAPADTEAAAKDPANAEAAPAGSGEKGEPEGGASEPGKEKQPCKCCIIM